MLKFKWHKHEPSPLDEAIADLAGDMRNGWSEEMPQQAAVLKTLMEAKAIESNGKISANTLATIAGSLTGIILILIFERSNVITSKGLGFVPKPKL